ncbi:hypothetical protein TWF569_009327 [Orbilia oligospora]|uniref:Uncharacterized protein n=1 Tax=Orbilia oligospora TaxID=2813651 RepID=A0A7C8JDU6_ORBOL|nr:hypothetical protein TWF102_011574 [Orbilia oligospora]KAF3094610.1 hypothetical protein TWF706_008447 [Orbilia oligospora]KAF3096488.1 hypothetical protein TWF103_009822 [Orbilia oligospora]KAF3137047.1 hypothetical protein TWF569_009327 [Orbilia oligospora]
MKFVATRDEADGDDIISGPQLNSGTEHANLHVNVKNGRAKKRACRKGSNPTGQGLTGSRDELLGQTTPSSTLNSAGERARGVGVLHFLSFFLRTSVFHYPMLSLDCHSSTLAGSNLCMCTWRENVRKERKRKQDGETRPMTIWHENLHR